MERVGGDRKLLREMVSLFAADASKMLENLRRAVTRQDANALFSAAHALKGALANFAARNASEAALQLESLGRSGTLDGAGARAAELEKETTQVVKSLQEYVGDKPEIKTPKSKFRKQGAGSRKQ
jgi:HPt (histidine-containing phosphotransfer) domain-containing protein